VYTTAAEAAAARDAAAAAAKEAPAAAAGLPRPPAALLLLTAAAWLPVDALQRRTPSVCTPHIFGGQTRKGVEGEGRGGELSLIKSRSSYSP